MPLVTVVLGLGLNAILTPANYQDDSVALSLLADLPGNIAFADLGYRSWLVKEQIGEETGFLWITRADLPEKRELISTSRQGIETTFSQLWN